MRTDIHIMGALTGGVGKTKVARLIAESMIRNDRKWRGIEADAINTTGDNGEPVFGLEQIYPGQASRLIFKRVDGKQTEDARDEWADTIMRFADDAAVEHVVIDVAASQIMEIMALLERTKVLDDLLTDGHQISIWLPIGSDPDKYKGVADWMAWIAKRPQFSGLIRPVILLDPNLGGRVVDIYDRDCACTVDIDFATWHKDPLRKAALDAGFIEIMLPALYPPKIYAQWKESLKSKPTSMTEWSDRTKVDRRDPLRGSKDDMARWLVDCNTVIVSVIRGETGKETGKKGKAA